MKNLFGVVIMWLFMPIINVNASSTISRKELEAVHIHVHSHCRTVDTHEYNTLREYVCINTPNMEWYEREEEEYTEKRIAQQLAQSWKPEPRAPRRNSTLKT